uniref:Mitochondrial import inner membrane translocase subunit TIM17 n=1 Tax=Plectus sambesii TaxID=2011161 RepID=A0A914XBG3_9BILA
MFSTIDCCIANIRQKEDPLNSIVSGGLTGALLTVRSGPRNMLISGVVGAFLLGMIEGVGVMMTRWTAPAYDPTMPPPDMQDPQNLPPKKESSPLPENTPFGMPTHLSMAS